MWKSGGEEYALELFLLTWDLVLAAIGLLTISLMPPAGPWESRARRAGDAGGGEFTGIDCGIKTMFYNHDNHKTYILDEYNAVINMDRADLDIAENILPSNSNSKNITDAVFLCHNSIILGEKTIEVKQMNALCEGHSLVRIYKDVFLVYNKEIKSWVLIRIFVP